MDNNWYYSETGEQSHGPVSIEDLGHVLSTNHGSENFFVWSPGMSDWARAGSVANLKRHFQQHTPPPLRAPPSDALATATVGKVISTKLHPWRRPSDYAFPGLGVSDLSAEQVDEFLLGIEIYAAIKRVNPIAYEKMRKEFLRGLRQGKTAGEMRTRIAPIADKVYSDILPQASSDLLMEYARLLVAQLNFLKQRSARDCYLYAKGSDNAAYEIASKYPLLDEKERAFQLKVVQAYRPNAFVVRDKKVTDAALATVLDVLQSRFGGDAKLVAEDRDRIPAEKYFAYCTVLAGFYEEVSRLPPSTGAAVLRGMLTTPIPNQPPQPPPPFTPIPNQPPQPPPPSAQKPP